jgi:hypothetical protein
MRRFRIEFSTGITLGYAISKEEERVSEGH